MNVATSSRMTTHILAALRTAYNTYIIIKLCSHGESIQLNLITHILIHN